MNKIFRSIWSDALQAFVAVAEIVSTGRSSSGKRFRLRLLVSSLVLTLWICTGFATASELPSGGTLVAGSGSITTSGQVMTIQQDSHKLIADWSSFNIGENHTVNFVQPGQDAAALNRVLGDQVSEIRGALNANGQVFLVNPNGIVFGATAQVNVGSLVASTLNITNDDFLAGTYRFEGSSTSAIINQGNINTASGGTIALVAARIINDGSLSAHSGNVLLGAGSKVLLDLGGPVKIEVEQGAIDALIEQGGAIKADGGLVYLAAAAAADLTSTVINNTGIIEAQTLATGERGEIYLMGDMVNGRIDVAGILDASAPNGGDGGFIETSAANVQILPDLSVTTKAEYGQTGEWLIDPVDITIAASGGNITGAALSSALGTSNVTLNTAGDGTCTNTACDSLGAGNGDIFVNDTVSWATNNTLTLTADRHIEVNANITHTGTATGGIIFLYGQGSANGGTSTYTATATVTSPSIQWRKGSALNSIRYAIVGGNYFLGNEYIELGVCGAAQTNCTGGAGKFGTSNKPSIFFGRTNVSGSPIAGIGMVGDADGFGVGEDLAIDYFLPGSPAEQFSVSFAGIAASNATAINFATLANSGTFGFEPLGADGTITLTYSAIQEGKLKVEQVVTLKPGDLFFDNEVTLTNVDTSTLNNVLFSRSFDPDNTQDKDGSPGYTTTQLIELSLAAGDGANVVSATSASSGPYYDRSGEQTAKIFYSSNHPDSLVGFDTISTIFFHGSNLPQMKSEALSLNKGDSITTDGGMGIIFDAGDMTAGQSKSFSYKTILDNRDVSESLEGAGVIPVVVQPVPTPEPEITAEPAVDATVNQVIRDVTGLVNRGVGTSIGLEIVDVTITPGDTEPAGDLEIVNVTTPASGGDSSLEGADSGDVSSPDDIVNNLFVGAASGIQRVYVVNGGINTGDTDEMEEM